MKTSQNRSLKIFLVSFAHMVVLISILFAAWIIINDNKKDTGKIVFRESINREGMYLLMVINPDGEHMQNIGTISGAFAISPDGKFVASGCLDMSKICIKSIEPLYDYHTFPYEPHFNQTNQEVSLPAECQFYFQDENISPVLLSISWSYTSEKLAIVCGDKHESRICFISLSEERTSYSCWNETDKYAFQAVWSPVDHKLAVSYPNEIIIFDESGQRLENPIPGWSPEWSPDGKQIVAFRWSEKTTPSEYFQSEYPGIAITYIDGTNLHWIYGPFDDSNVGQYVGNILLPLCEDIGGGCNLAWSPDGHSIAFAARLGFSDDWQIYRIKVDDGEIMALTNHLSRLYSLPDWAP